FTYIPRSPISTLFPTRRSSDLLVAELSSQQNIIAVVVDDSRSMSIADSEGKTREAAAVEALEGGVLAGLRQRFQTRLYRLGRELDRKSTRLNSSHVSISYAVFC